MNKSIGVEIIRAVKKKRRIIIELESDLYSSEVFAVTPFYDEGDAKNQLQAVNLQLNIKEVDGEVSADVQFSNCLGHFTKGHSQLHSPLTTFFKDKKDCARAWAKKESRKYLTQERIKQVLKLWEGDDIFVKELQQLISDRSKQLKDEEITRTRKLFLSAAAEYASAAEEVVAPDITKKEA